MEKKFIWMTDVHLDCFSEKNRRKWCEEKKKEIPKEDVAGILITGDIASSSSVFDCVELIRSVFELPVYYVFGNHDVWGTSMSWLHAEAQRRSSKEKSICWMGSVDFIDAGGKIAIIGHDSWYDTRNGIFNVDFAMEDWFRISEFRSSTRSIKEVCQEFSSIAVDHITKNCKIAIENGKTEIVILMHVPPFKESCFYKGKSTEDYALPVFSSKIMGEALNLLSLEYPDVNFLVLCGHTHSPSDIRFSNNLRVIVGESRYYHPSLQMIGVKDE